ncbi:DinB family protein [bacterium]|nr:DinB family protein [bacterium]MBU1073998.1 DinB family protein [bacterium]MBU1675123.1 DinB family protein [bacterium]
MFRKLDDFFSGYQNLVEGTKKIIAVIDTDSMCQNVVSGHRTLRGVAWHIVTTVPEMMNKLGLGLSSVDEKSLPPGSPDEVRDAYDRVTDELVAALKAKWSDDDLKRTDELYGETWPRGVTLKILMDHEIHHRGQMTVLLRQAGRPVPGIYGPSQEEWARYGMELPPY